MMTPAGETPPTTFGAPDVSLAATPAVEDLKNALQTLQGAVAEIAYQQTGGIGWLTDLDKDLGAVARLLRQALSKLEQGAR